VLHHVPPKTYPGASGEEAEAAELLQIYHPEYFISGHTHQFPYFVGNSWAQRIDGVNVLVPGQLLSAPFPKPHRFEYGVRGSQLGDVGSGVDF